MKAFALAAFLASLTALAAAVPIKPECESLGQDLNMTDLATGRYYFHDIFDYAQWSEANIKCWENGLELVTVNSREELDAIYNVYPGASMPWTSARCAQDLVFRWANDEVLPFDSELWGPDQPDNCDENSSFACAKIWDYALIDEPCTNMWQYVCEVPQHCYV